MKRLGSSGRGEGQGALPKPLVPLAGRPLLEHLLSRLLKISPRRIVLVLGHGRREIEQLLEGLSPKLELEVELLTVLNPKPERENGYSLLQAEGLVGEQFLVAMADHLIDPGIYRAAADHQGLGLCVDFSPPAYLDVDEATKVLVEGGKVLKIGKELKEWNGLDTGVFALTPLAFQALRQLAAGQQELTLTEMVSELIELGHPPQALDVSGLPWIDIDTPEDLERAEDFILIL